LVAQAEYNYYEKAYNISGYKELPFCVVVPTFNNLPSNRYLRNIRSIIGQNYTNYHIVVIDDGSTDNTGQRIQQYLISQTKVPA
jgi:glycosyltransferase involved in cell wall biosynthesis